MSIFQELRRRNVIRVAIGYVVISWLVLQVADVVINNIGAPEWVFRALLLFLGLGLLFAIFFSWAFEMTPEGLKRERDVDRSRSITHETGRKLDRAIIVVLVVAVAYFAFDKFALSPGREEAAIESAMEEQAPDAAPVVDATEPDKSIAVLPFVNMSSDPEQDYFSDGLSEELLNLLAKIPDLRVAARTSSFALKGKDMQISEIGELLKVAHVLEGSVRTSGDRVRITAQLIQSGDGYHVWSETFDRRLDDVFAIQDEIAARVVEALKVTLLGTSPKVHEVDPDAYALVLQGRHFLHQRSEESLARAEELFGKALEIAPDYAVALNGLAQTYADQAGGGLRPVAAGYRLAAQRANEAISADPGYAPAYSTLGYISLLINDPAAAARHFTRALELEPANLEIINEAAVLMELLGRPDEAFRMIEFVVARDPINADGHAGLGRAYRVSQRWDEAIASYRTSLALAPARYGSWQGMGEALLFKGEAQAALEAYANEPDEEWKTKGTALALHELGREAEFEASFQELRERWGEAWPSEIAHVYAWIGDNDAAFEWLNRAVDQNEEGLFQQYYQPLLRSLHDDPRWGEFRERTIGREEVLARIRFDVNLPESQNLAAR